MRIITTALMALASLTAGAQHWEQEAKSFLMAKGKTVASVHPAAPPGVLQLIRETGVFVIDSGYDVPSKAIRIVYNIAVHAADPLAAEACVEVLLQPVQRGDAELAAFSLALLKTFPQSAFSIHARTILRQAIERSQTNLKDLMKLAGFLGMNETTETLRRYSLPGNPVGMRWAAIVSLARMGDERAIGEMMTRIKKLPVNDEVVYSIFPDVVYTREKSAVQYLVQLLQSDETGCRSADAEKDVAIPCAYRILEQLTPVIEGFPLALDETGDLTTGDYPGALKTARTWFAANGRYRIINDKY